jgi:hypothetical protein
MRSDIGSETDRLRLTAKLLYFVVITRNQVAHDLNTDCVLFGDTDLCKRVSRLIFIATMHNAYL